MLNIRRLTPLGVAVFLILLLVAFPFAALSSDDRPRPVTAELLKSLDLDRAYHRCTHVADGDTFTLDGLGTVRFIGVDTPEKNHPVLPMQFMAQEASAFTRGLCLNQQIRLEYDPHDADKRGNYGRILGYAYLKDGTFVQEALLEQGYAVAYTKYPFDEVKKLRFLAIEREARARGVKIWKDGGMPEVRWVIGQKQALMELERVSPATWRLRFGEWGSDSFPCAEAAQRLNDLYSAIYSLCPRDLRKRFKELGFHQRRPRSPVGGNLMVIGMAHRTWGLIHGRFARPRVSSETLPADLQALSQWMDRAGGRDMKTRSIGKGYYPLPEGPTTAQATEIADTLLTAYRVRTTGRSAISWETAGRHIGKRVCVEGKILRTHNSGKACYLNFHNNFTRYVSLVIFQEDLWKFPLHPDSFYLNKTVLVRGKIETYEGKPEMILHSPKQITIIEGSLGQPISRLDGLRWGSIQFAGKQWVRHRAAS